MLAVCNWSYDQSLRERLRVAKGRLQGTQHRAMLGTMACGDSATAPTSASSERRVEGRTWLDSGTGAKRVHRPITHNGGVLCNVRA